MPADPDSQNIVQWLAAALFGGGGGYKLVTHETRIRRLEKDREVDIKKVDDTVATVAKMEGTLDEVSETVTDIRNLLMNRGGHR